MCIRDSFENVLGLGNITRTIIGEGNIIELASLGTATYTAGVGAASLVALAGAANVTSTALTTITGATALVTSAATAITGTGGVVVTGATIDLNGPAGISLN